MPLNFDLVEVNPNDSTGGGGTLAGPMHDKDATGPYFVWPNQEFESYISPHAVVAASEVRLMAAALAAYEAGDAQVLAGGERQTAPPAVNQDTGAGQQNAAPEFDFSDPEQFARAAEYARGE